MTQAEITKEKLIEDGWVEPTDKDTSMIIYLEKLIENRNPINDSPEDTDIKLIIHGFYNSHQFALLFPDGGILNFIANSMEELKDFENKIDFYDCPY